jgi:hypothetical protein
VTVQTTGRSAADLLRCVACGSADVVVEAADRDPEVPNPEPDYLHCLACDAYFFGRHA